MLTAYAGNPHYVVDLWFERKVKPQFSGKAELFQNVRYADDLWLFLERPEHVDTMRTLLQARLPQFGLALADEKTHKTNLGGQTNTEKRERAGGRFWAYDLPDRQLPAVLPCRDQLRNISDVFPAFVTTAATALRVRIRVFR